MIDPDVLTRDNSMLTDLKMSQDQGGAPVTDKKDNNLGSHGEGFRMAALALSERPLPSRSTLWRNSSQNYERGSNLE